MVWGALFDRPTPELFRVESPEFVHRTELAGGGLFTEAVGRDGTFCWRLPPGRYFISRIVPFQDNAAPEDDTGRNIFPGVAFRIDETGRPVYLGTLRIAVPVAKDFMGNRRMAGKPSIEVLDEFDRDHALLKELRAVELHRNIMFRVPGLEGMTFHPKTGLPPAVRAHPWLQAAPGR